MKYAECPTVTVSVDVDASPGAVWALVSDVAMSLETLLDLTVQAGREVADSHTQGATT